MDNILPTSDYKEVEGRYYVNPEAALNEANQFIDNLRATQAQQNQEIATQTENLGTTLPSVQGGLGTNTPNNLSYFTSRYQTPQTASVMSDLRSAAQAAALSQVLQDQQAMWKKKYQDAYRSYQKRSYDKTYGGGSGGGGGGNNGGNSSTWDGGIDEEATDPQNRYGVPNANVRETDTEYIYKDPNTGKEVRVLKSFMNKLYDENGKLTDEGAVILDTRNLLGL